MRQMPVAWELGVVEVQHAMYSTLHILCTVPTSSCIKLVHLFCPGLHSDVMCSGADMIAKHDDREAGEQYALFHGEHRTPEVPYAKL